MRIYLGYWNILTNTPPQSEWRFPNAQAGAKLCEQCRQKSFCKDVCVLQMCWDVKNSNMAQRNSFPNEMNVNLDMFGPLMMNWVRGQVDGRDVAAVGYRCLGERTPEIKEQVSKPRCLGHCIGHTTILCFGTGSRYSIFRLDDQEMRLSPRNTQ